MLAGIAVRDEPDGHTTIYRLCHRRLGRDSRVDSTRAESGDLLRVIYEIMRHILISQARLAEDVTELGIGGRTRPYLTEFHALEIGDAFHLAAVHQFLPDKQWHVVVGTRRRALVGHDLDVDAARHRIVETRRGRPRSDIDLSRAERRNHLWTGIEGNERDVQALLGEKSTFGS